MTIYDFIFTVDLPTSVILISPESGINITLHGTLIC